jgi:hypothetical protein
MQFSFRLVAILAVFFLASPVVTAEDQIRIALNKGVAHPDMYCTASEFTAVSSWITVSLWRRNLRLGNVETKDGEPDVDNKDTTMAHQERKLPFYPASCKTTCQGFAPRTCIAVACKGFRRELEATEENDRDLLSVCEFQKEMNGRILTALSKTTLVSKPCQALLQAPRTIECIYNVVC